MNNLRNGMAWRGCGVEEADVNKERLLKLADHLERGKLGHERFDYEFYNYSDKDGDNIKGCGTAGCAIGECPIAFPKQWKWHYGYPILRRKSFISSEDARTFFGLSGEQSSFLFYTMDGNNPLPVKATRLQVALHIRQFVRNNGIYWRKAS